jgi:hypothetical protein
MEEKNKREFTMVKVKAVLKDTLNRHEQKRRERDPFYSIYADLQESLNEGFSQSHVYLWVNPNNTTFPEPEQLLRLCDYLGDYTPLKAVIEYFNYRMSLKGAKDGK